jgi:hypothetical protein
MSTETTIASHLRNITITDDEAFIAELHGLTDDVLKEVELCHKLVNVPDTFSGVHLRKQTERHPNVPMFWNFYSSYLYAIGERNMARKWMQETLQRFPAYVIGVADEAVELCRDREHKKALELLGPALRIEDRFKDRTVFHEREVEAYEAACIRYLVNAYRTPEARERFDALVSHIPGSVILADLDLIVRAGEVRDGIRNYDLTLAAVPPDARKVYADEALELKEPALRPIFRYAARLPQPRIDAILALPQETLVEELHGVLRFAIREVDRYDQLKRSSTTDDELSFVLHALLLLGEIPGERSLEAVLHFYEQDVDVLDTYMERHLLDAGLDPIIKLAHGHLVRLRAFMMSDVPRSIAKSVIAEGVTRLARNRPELLPELEIWIGDLMDHFVNGTGHVDQEIIDELVLHAIALRSKTLLPRIEDLVKKDVISTDVAGTLRDIRRAIASPLPEYGSTDVVTIEERYMAMREEEALQAMGGVEEEGDEPFDLEPQIPFVRSDPRTGRNDPCPCGSGKKFKKCCLD